MNPRKFQVLLVEADPREAELLKESLQGQGGQGGLGEPPFEVTQWAAHMEQAESILRTQSFDLVLLDLCLPDCVGMEAFFRLRTLVPELPLIVLCGNENEKLAIRAVKEGARDYLVKSSVTGELMSRALRYAIERHRADQELAAERNLMRELLDNIPDRIYFKDKESRFLRINRAMASFFGLKSPREALGKSDFDFFSLEHAQPAFEDEQQVMRTGQPIIGLVEKEVTPQGYVGWAFTTKMPLLNEQGEMIGTFGISRDITQLKAMEDALDGERNLLRSVIENIPDPICLQDPKGFFILGNPAHRSFLGVNEEAELLGKQPACFLPQPVAAQDQQNALRVLQSGQPEIEHEELVRDARGREHWMLVTRIPVREEQGKIAGLLSIWREITEKKLASEALQQANKELTRTLEDLQRSNEELRDTQLQLMEAEKLKSVGRLAAGVAHEVKNPLSIINMGLHYFQQQQPFSDPHAPMILREMAEAVQRADLVIRGMLDFSVPKKLEIKAEDLNEIINQSVLLARVEIPDGGVKVETDLQGNLPLVNLDAMKISQVFVNLLTNSIHAMECKGWLRIHSSLLTLPSSIPSCAGGKGRGFTAGEKAVCVEVEDNGPGVPEEVLPRIFEPFYTTKQTGKGTGLGLAVVRSILELHGASILAENRPQGGLKITILFKT